MGRQRRQAGFSILEMVCAILLVALIYPIGKLALGKKVVDDYTARKSALAMVEPGAKATVLERSNFLAEFRGCLRKEVWFSVRLDRPGTPPEFYKLCCAPLKAECHDVGKK